MATLKNVQVEYVAAIPTERSCIGQDVPAHVRLLWRDAKDRRCAQLLDLRPELIEEIGKLTDRATSAEGTEERLRALLEGFVYLFDTSEWTGSDFAHLAGLIARAHTEATVPRKRKP